MILKVKDKFYGEDLILYVGPRDDFITYLSKKYKVAVNAGESKDGQYCQVRDHKGKLHHYMWLRDFQWRIMDLGLLVHEIFHYMNWVLDDIGLELTKESEEAYTYFYQAVYQDVLEKLAPLHSGYKKKMAEMKKKRVHKS